MVKYATPPLAWLGSDSEASLARASLQSIIELGAPLRLDPPGLQSLAPRACAAERVVRIPRITQRLESHCPRVDHQQPSDQPLIAIAEPAHQDTDRLHRHQRAKHTGERAQYPGLRAGRDGSGLRRIGKKAAIGRVGFAI